MYYDIGTNSNMGYLAMKEKCEYTCVPDRYISGVKIRRGMGHGNNGYDMVADYKGGSCGCFTSYFDIECVMPKAQQIIWNI